MLIHILRCEGRGESSYPFGKDAADGRSNQQRPDSTFLYEARAEESLCSHNVLDIRYDDRYNAPTTADRTPTMAQRSSAYLETIIAFLLPYFSAAAADIKDARSEIIDTLASYATRTRAEMLQAAHI
jgi:hypothetical protein